NTGTLCRRGRRKDKYRAQPAGKPFQKNQHVQTNGTCGFTQSNAATVKAEVTAFLPLVTLKAFIFQ
ncbi:MAG: hypothetical protein Q8Q50_11995, partial [Methylobacter sp.]|nr:hypothetical protein [Methylobacter sp.]